jgi:threonyl-tRNA synthetase
VACAGTVRILTESEKCGEYAKSVEQKLRAKGIRVQKDLRNEKIGAKIRERHLALVPYLAVGGVCLLRTSMFCFTAGWAVCLKQGSRNAG